MRAEHILPTGNHPRTWRNTLCRPEIDPRRGGTHSAGRKSTRDVVEQTLPTGNHPRTWRNTLCRPEIDPGLGGTHSADRKSSQDKRKLTWEVAEHTLPTGNWREGSKARSACAPRFLLLILLCQLIFANLNFSRTSRVQGELSLLFPNLKFLINLYWKWLSEMLIKERDSPKLSFLLSLL